MTPGVPWSDAKRECTNKRQQNTARYNTARKKKQHKDIHTAAFRALDLSESARLCLNFDTDKS